MTPTHLDRKLEALRRTIEALPAGSKLAVVREARGFRFYIDEVQKRQQVPVAQSTVPAAPPPPLDNG